MGTKKRSRITIFNRKEVFLTCNLKELHEAREILEANQIPCFMRLNNGSILTTGRCRGMPFLDTDVVNQYQLLVHKKDYERAVHLLPQMRE